MPSLLKRRESENGVYLAWKNVVQVCFITVVSLSTPCRVAVPSTGAIEAIDSSYQRMHLCLPIVKGRDGAISRDTAVFISNCASCHVG